jgi:gliding motility-associated lipoprotein GldH
MANLWCFIQIKDSAQTILRDTLNIKIAEPDGRWLGKGNSIKTLETPSHIHMLNAGKYTFDIIQGMRTRSLNGIKNVGLVIRTKETNH